MSLTTSVSRCFANAMVFNLYLTTELANWWSNSLTRIMNLWMVLNQMIFTWCDCCGRRPASYIFAWVLIGQFCFLVQGFVIEIGADYFGGRERWVFFWGCGGSLICLRGVRVRWAEWFIWRWGDRNDSLLILYYLPIYSNLDHDGEYNSQTMSFTIFVWSDALKTTKTSIFSISKKTGLLVSFLAFYLINYNEIFILNRSSKLKTLALGGYFVLFRNHHTWKFWLRGPIFLHSLPVLLIVFS